MSRTKLPTELRPVNPQALVSSLEWCEVDGSLAPDCRRTLRDERFSLVNALRSGDGAKIAAARDEAVRVMGMWGIEVAS